MPRRCAVMILLLVLLCTAACCDTWKIEEIDIGPCSVSVTAEQVSQELLQVTVLPLEPEEGIELPEAFTLYAGAEAVGMAYPAEEGGWLGFAPYISDTLILVPVRDGL